MIQEPRKLHRAGLLFAAAALPLTPLLAQETQPDPQPPPQASIPPVIDVPPPPVSQTAPPPAVTSTPAPAEDAEASADEPQPARTTARTTRSTPARTTTRSRAASTAPAAAAAPVAQEPAAEPPAESLVTAEPVPGLVTDTLPETDMPEEPQGQGALWPWLLAGALLVAALALLLVRRRRVAQRSYAESYEEPAAPISSTPEPVTASAIPGAAAASVSTLVRKVQRPDPDPAEAVPTMEPPLAPELAGAPMAAAPMAAARNGRPRLDLKVRPLRAGVQEQNVLVDFELRIENNGAGAARDVAVATWVYADGAGAPSEAERTLIEHPASDTISDIGPGDSSRIQRSAALPVAQIETDSILPVVVVDIRYRRTDGKEERASASFAVGVPIDGDLAHFDLENPSGLHERVVARPVGQLDRA